MLNTTCWTARPTPSSFGLSPPKPYAVKIHLELKVLERIVAMLE